MPLAALELPGWVGWLIALGSLGGGLTAVLFTVLRNKRIAGEYVQPPGRLVFPVQVRGADGPTLARFCAVWNEATRCLVMYQSAWVPEKVRGVLEAGSRVQVRPELVWEDPAGQKVGGQYWAGVCILNRTLDSMVHELAHHLSQRLTGYADDEHALYQVRGLGRADREFREWLARQAP